MIGNDEQKLSYEKPEVVFWPAAELDAIQAAMSGGGGGSSGGGGAVYHVTTYSRQHGGALRLTVSTSKTATLLVTAYDSGGWSSSTHVYETVNGTVTHLLFVRFALRLEVKIRYTGACVTTCSFSLLQDLAGHDGYGAQWTPDDWEIRPTASPICRMRWYVSEAFSYHLYDLTQHALFDSIWGFVVSSLPQEATSRVMVALGCAGPEAAAVVGALLTLVSLGEIAMQAALRDAAYANVGTDYVLAVNDHGDGGSPSLTSQMSIESWDAGAMTGEAGYAGTFVDNKTFTEAS